MLMTSFVYGGEIGLIIHAVFISHFRGDIFASDILLIAYIHLECIYIHLECY